jgi:hypothetical protein
VRIRECRSSAEDVDDRTAQISSVGKLDEEVAFMVALIDLQLRRGTRVSDIARILNTAEIELTNHPNTASAIQM